jgi:hypothetical protein
VTIYFSKTSNGFYDSDIHGNNLPEDAVQITQAQHIKLLEAQTTGKTISHDENGKPISASPTPITIGQLKQNRKDFINRERERVFSEGFEHNGVIYDCDDIAKTNVTGLVAAITAGISLPENFTWRSKDNKNIPMTSEDVVLLGTAMMIYRNTVMNKSWALKDLIDSKTTKAAINNIDWGTGIE